jgi:hypothetical protein
MKFMELSGEQMGEQKKGYVVAGTMSSMGEEVSARGKIMVFDVMEVYCVCGVWRIFFFNLLSNHYLMYVVNDNV